MMSTFFYFPFFFLSFLPISLSLFSLNIRWLSADRYALGGGCVAHSAGRRLVSDANAKCRHLSACFQSSKTRNEESLEGGTEWDGDEGIRRRSSTETKRSIRKLWRKIKTPTRCWALTPLFPSRFGKVRFTRRLWEAWMNLQEPST